MAECKASDSDSFASFFPSGDLEECKEGEPENEKLCEACEEDNTLLPAVGFCIDCQQYLCEECFQCHCRPKPMKNHRLLNKEDMPKKKVSEDLSELCKKHEGETIKYYCKTHDEVGCNSCMLLEHKPCGDLSTLAEAATGVNQSQPYIDLCNEIREIEEELNKQMVKAVENIKKSTMQYDVAIKKIESLREAINEHFNKLQENIKDEAKNTLETDTAKIEEVQDRVSLVKNEQNELKEDLEILEKTNQFKQLFIATSKSKKQVESLKERVFDIAKDNSVKTYKFTETDNIRGMLENSSEIGTLLNLDERNQLQHSLPTTTLENYEEFGIAKCSSLGLNCLAIIYPSTNRVQVIQNGQLCAEKYLASRPWDICTVSPKLFAITLPYERMINVFHTGTPLHQNQITLSQAIPVQAQCEGIDYKESRFYVACSDPAVILILEGNGTCIKTITTKATDIPTFEQPAYIEFDVLQQNIFVTDRQAQRIYVFSSEGKNLGVCGSNDFQQPLWIVGTVFHINLSRRK